MVELVHWYSIDHRDFAMVVLEHKDHVEVLEMKLDALEVDKFHFIESNYQRRLHTNVTAALAHQYANNNYVPTDYS